MDGWLGKWMDGWMRFCSYVCTFPYVYRPKDGVSVTLCHTPLLLLKPVRLPPPPPPPTPPFYCSEWAMDTRFEDCFLFFTLVSRSCSAYLSYI